MKILGEKLAKERKKKGMTQDELAKKAYLSKQTISNIERGITKNINETVLNLLSFALFVTPDYLVGKSEYPDKNSKGLIVPYSMLPPWDYDFEIKELMKAHSNNRIVETLIRNIIHYLTYVDHSDCGVKILENTISILKKEDKKTIDILLKITKGLNE
ncbi:helix-turn-helix domain-containing protein [Tissierella pigra]|uniref:Helix-turn-helix transcriptional regulator n=1 Tax=Tissierella pigra TaxID=2607614 RepID=A0A6N7XJ92_9FIRM|nr:helix-turn-helix transcriptional regulator [Tissierella pigra]MSU02119.1 helix-turn-helix transcriptional regulator [Tissierella pigra]